VGFAGASTSSFLPPTLFLALTLPVTIKAGRNVPLAATRIYQLAFFTGFGVSSIVYYLLNRAFPVPGRADRFKEVDESHYLDDMDGRPDWEEREESQEEEDNVSTSKSKDDGLISVDV
jgi:hypothetical protein